MGNVIVVSQIKELARVEEQQLNVATDFYEALNEKVKDLIKKACIRAKQNNRNTVMGRDV